MTFTKKLWIGVGVLVLLSPLGLIIPALFGAGGAWGEWGVEEVRKLIGFVPAGMDGHGERWKAPMQDYSVTGRGTGLLDDSLGYMITAVIGVAATAGIMYLVARTLARKK